MGYTLDYYKNQLESIKRDIQQRKQKNQKIQDQINRLNDAYNTLYRIKHSNNPNANEVRNDAKKDKTTSGFSWNGKSKDEYDKSAANEVQAKAKSFYDSIDAMLDALNNARTKKKNEKSSGIAILDGLNNAKNNIVGIITNWVN